MTKYQTENKYIEIFDLPQLFLADFSAANNFLKQAQKIYMSSFPPEEREPTIVVRRNINSAIQDARTGRSYNQVFSYLVATVDGVVRGMTSFNIMFNSLTVAFAGYIVTQKKWRGSGIAKKLVDGIVQKMNRCNAARGKPKSGILFVEVEQPDLRKTDVMRDIVRPDFQTECVRVLVPVIEQKNGKCLILPYKQPGIKVRGDSKTPPPVPLLPGFSIIHNGKLGDIPAGIVGNAVLNGRLNSQVNIPEMSAEKAFDIVSCILKVGYQGQAYGRRQAQNILDGIEKTLQKTNKVHLIPIVDTAKLPPVGRV